MKKTVWNLPQIIDESTYTKPYSIFVSFYNSDTEQFFGVIGTSQIMFLP